VPGLRTASANSVWCDCMATVPTEHSLRLVIRVVAILNLAYFGVEFAVSRLIGSVSLFVDSIDFLENA
jgi:Co/Zn/Cd efflux system component